MGYSLTIGEAEIDYEEDHVRITAEGVTLPEAPAFGEPTDHTSMRWPSYSGWSHFCEALDIVDLMFDSRNGGRGEFEWQGKHYMPLIQEHPGAAAITAAHVEYVAERLERYKQQHPDHIAQYPPPKPGAKPIMGDLYRQEDCVDDPRFDSTLCRGEWLLFWLRWAVQNCKRPVFVNS